MSPNPQIFSNIHQKLCNYNIRISPPPHHHHHYGAWPQHCVTLNTASLQECGCLATCSPSLIPSEVEGVVNVLSPLTCWTTLASSQFKFCVSVSECMSGIILFNLHQFSLSFWRKTNKYSYPKISDGSPFPTDCLFSVCFFVFRVCTGGCESSTAFESGSISCRSSSGFDITSAGGGSSSGIFGSSIASDWPCCSGTGFSVSFSLTVRNKYHWLHESPECLFSIVLKWLILSVPINWLCVIRYRPHVQNNTWCVNVSFTLALSIRLCNSGFDL